MLHSTLNPRPLEDTAGIPTGIGIDIAAQVERRRQRNAALLQEQAARERETVETVKGETAYYLTRPQRMKPFLKKVNPPHDQRRTRSATGLGTANILRIQ